MNLTRTTTSITAAAMILLAAACDRDDAQVLTDTSAAGSFGGGSAASEQLEAAPARIQQALRADSTLRAFELEAEAEGSRIVLKGTVRSEQQKALATQIATRDAGGIQVENQIRVEGR